MQVQVTGPILWLLIYKKEGLEKAMPIHRLIYFAQRFSIMTRPRCDRHGLHEIFQFAAPCPAGRWTIQTVGMNGDILDKMERAVAKVRERLLRATAALNAAGLPLRCGRRQCG
jgi:hypothetical protein